MRHSALLPSLLALVLGCSTATLHETETVTLTITPALRALPAQDLFAEAGDEFDVPADLLAVLAWHQSSMAPGEEDHDEHAPAHGWMGLSPDQIAEAAALTGLSLASLERGREESVFGGAAILDALRARLAPGASATEADGSWWPVVVAFPGYDEEWLNHSFAADVFQTLQVGLAVPTEGDDLVEIASRALPELEDVRFVLPPSADSTAFAGGADYAGAARFTAAYSGNQSTRSGGASAIRRVVIHTTEGSYAGAISWFRNPSANVSAHYVIRKSDGEITQMVRDAGKAWHACSNNDDTIGIEHEGASSSAATWTPAMVDASARLTAYLVTRYNIPVDRDHIVGHGEIQPSSCAFRSDPGTHFNWTQYLQKVNSYRTGGSGGSSGSGSGGSGSGGGSTTPPPPPAPTATVAFQSPRDGDTIGNPVQMRIKQTGAHHVNVFAGPTLIAQDLAASPVHVGRLFSTVGARTLTVKAYSPSGAVLATDTVDVTVVNTTGTLAPSATQVSGMAYRMNAVASGTFATVRYWVDGYALTDTGNGSQSVPGPNYRLDYTFNYAAPGRQLVARGYNASGTLVAEGFAYIDVNTGSLGTAQEILQVNVQEAGGTVMYLRSTASPGVAFVEYLVDGWRLPDMVSGATFAVPNDFSLWYQFVTWGNRNLEVRAYDASWALVDSWTQTISVPAPAVEVSWTRLGVKRYRFDGDVPAGTQRLVIEIDGWALPDSGTGNQWTTGPEFILNYTFNYGGLRALRAKAYDAAGNVLSTYTTNIQVY